jgi:two-component system, NarL family, response regulator LiaR
MNPATPPRGERPPIAIGVYDEPELIVSGIDGMLAHHGRVVTLAPDEPTTDVDVVLCDPIGRAVQIEEYLGLVAALTLAPVLVFTWSKSPSSVRRSLAAGARGYLSKAVSSADLVAAVNAIHRGEPVTPSIEAAGHAVQLSVRETEVLDLICRGMSNLEIADQLFVSVNSVKTYVRQIYQKVGVTRRSQAVAWGLEHGY